MVRSPNGNDWEADLWRRILIRDAFVAVDPNTGRYSLGRFRLDSGGNVVIPECAYCISTLDPFNDDDELYALERQVGFDFHLHTRRSVERRIGRLRNQTEKLGERNGIPRHNNRDALAPRRAFELSRKKYGVKRKLFEHSLRIPETALLIVASPGFAIFGEWRDLEILLPDGENREVEGWEIEGKAFVGPESSEPREVTFGTTVHEIVHAFDSFTGRERSSDRICNRIDGNDIARDREILRATAKLDEHWDNPSRRHRAGLPFTKAEWKAAVAAALPPGHPILEGLDPGDPDFGKEALGIMHLGVLKGLELEGKIYRSAWEYHREGTYWPTKTEHLAYFVETIRQFEDESRYLYPSSGVLGLFAMVAPNLTRFYTEVYLPQLHEMLLANGIDTIRWTGGVEMPGTQVEITQGQATLAAAKQAVGKTTSRE